MYTSSYGFSAKLLRSVRCIAIQFNLLHQVHSDVLPKQIVIGHVPILYGEHPGPQNRIGLIQSLPSVKLPESDS